MLGCHLAKRADWAQARSASRGPGKQRTAIQPIGAPENRKCLSRGESYRTLGCAEGEPWTIPPQVLVGKRKPTALSCAAVGYATCSTWCSGVHHLQQRPGF